MPRPSFRLLLSHPASGAQASVQTRLREPSHSRNSSLGEDTQKEGRENPRENKKSRVLARTGLTHWWGRGAGWFLWESQACSTLSRSKLPAESFAQTRLARHLKWSAVWLASPSLPGGQAHLCSHYIRFTLPTQPLKALLSAPPPLPQGCALQGALQKLAFHTETPRVPLEC